MTVAGLFVTAACTPKGAQKAEEEGNKHALTPTYAPASAAPTTLEAITTPPGGPSETPSAPEPTTAVPSASTSTVAAGPVTASVTDPTGDVTPSPLDPPPPWADLASADLTRDATGFTLKVHLGGGQAPTSTDSNHTMNIASFYDLDGDGAVDVEIWANLADSGWGTSMFNDRNGRATFQAASGVSVGVDGDAVVLRFPVDHLRDASTFRWSLASEWGRYATIGTELAARDDMPDNDQPATFPG